MTHKSHPQRDAALALEKSDKLEAALEAFLRAKLVTDAGRVARKLGRHMQAAQLYEAAGSHYEAAVCFSDAGNKEACLSHLLQVPHAHKHYRACCVKAIAIAHQANAPSAELDRLVAPFANSAPQNDTETQAVARYRKLQATPRSEARTMHLGPRKSPGVLPGLPSLPPPPEVAPTPAAFATNVSQAPAAEATQAGVAPTAVSSVAQQAPTLSAATLKPGDVIAGRYKLDARIGEGGMAAVFRAQDTELDEAVAIKVFASDESDPEIVARFKQELALARKLAHPNVLRMYDLGMDRGCRFITMELLYGKTLRDVIREGTLTLAQCLDLLSQACAGLQAAHDAGVVHRDIKPENLFVTDQGIVKVMDFGIAKNTAASNRTRTGVLAGTAAYMAPEQVEGFSHVTALADIYAIGVVAYELCTGAPPFSHPEMVPLLMMHVKQKPQPPIEVNPRLPRVLNDLILRLLAKNPDQRIQSCRELAAHFDRLRGNA
jgi:eukaryotic-like serine/threonine-protein kinase